MFTDHLRGKYFTIFSSMVNTAVPSVDLKIWREKDIKPNHWKIKLWNQCDLSPPASHVLFSVPPLLLTADCSAVSGHKLEQLTANGPHLHHPHIILPCSLPACWHVTYLSLMSPHIWLCFVRATCPHLDRQHRDHVSDLLSEVLKGDSSGSAQSQLCHFEWINWL